ncbi:hypothetical protein CASFOL_000607 [Castilleja foliolosa]|uniref:Uncharacterized protein n=1 Tax=Castilleja foliolosa TaxID=1961234 RepID=A0ABD3ENH1_9LAMI
MHVDRFSPGGVSSALIHGLYSRGVMNHVHLTADTKFRTGNAAIMAFVLLIFFLEINNLPHNFKKSCWTYAWLMQRGLDELEETRVKLEELRSDTTAYKSKIDAMVEQLKEQAAQITKFMAFMELVGHNDQDLARSDYEYSRPSI